MRTATFTPEQLAALSGLQRSDTANALTLFAYLAEQLPAVWTLCDMPAKIKHYRHGVHLNLGACSLYVAAKLRHGSVLVLCGDAVVFAAPNTKQRYLLPTIRDAVRAALALYPCDAPEWATETAP